MMDILRRFAYQPSILGVTRRKPVLWRRVHGFAQNINLLDRVFLFGSLVLIAVWFAVPSHYAVMSRTHPSLAADWPLWVLGYGSVVLLYAAGETERRDTNPKLPRLKSIQKPLLGAGLIAFAGWGFELAPQIGENLSTLLVDPEFTISGGLMVVIISIAVIYWKSRDGKTTMV